MITGSVVCTLMTGVPLLVLCQAPVYVPPLVMVIGALNETDWPKALAMDVEIERIDDAVEIQIALRRRSDGLAEVLKHIAVQSRESTTPSPLASASATAELLSNRRGSSGCTIRVEREASHLRARVVARES